MTLGKGEGVILGKQVLLVILDKQHTTRHFSVIAKSAIKCDNITGSWSLLIFFLGTAEYNFTFVPHFTRFHWSNKRACQNLANNIKGQ